MVLLSITSISVIFMTWAIVQALLKRNVHHCEAPTRKATWKRPPRSPKGLAVLSSGFFLNLHYSITLNKNYNIIFIMGLRRLHLGFKL